MIKGIDNVGVCTTDVERLIAFYQILGFSEAYRNDRGVMVAANSVNLFIFATQQNNPSPVRRERWACSAIHRASIISPWLLQTLMRFIRRCERLAWGSTVLGRPHGRSQGPAW